MSERLTKEERDTLRKINEGILADCGGVEGPTYPEIVNRALDTIDALEAELKEANGHLHRVSKGYKTIGAYDALEAERDELRARVTNQLSELISLRASVLGAKELERQRDEALEWLRKCETLFERYLAASAIDLDWREMDELPPPKVRIVTRCPTTGVYEHDGSEVDSHILEPGDDVRLRFDGEVLRLEDVADSNMKMEPDEDTRFGGSKCCNADYYTVSNPREQYRVCCACKARFDIWREGGAA